MSGFKSRHYTIYDQKHFVAASLPVFPAELLPPTDARLRSADKHQITFEWSAPENIAKVNYTVRLYSTFWGQDWSHAENETFHTFGGLKSGTNYGFEVRTVANGAKSDPAVASNYTGESLGTSGWPAHFSLLAANSVSSAYHNIVLFFVSFCFGVEKKKLTCSWF